MGAPGTAKAEKLTFSLVPGAIAVGAQGLPVAREFLDPFRFHRFLRTEGFVDRYRFLYSFHADAIQFAEHPVLGSRPGALAADDLDAVFLGQPFEAGGLVDGIAAHGIGDTDLRSHVAD